MLLFSFFSIFSNEFDLSFLTFLMLEALKISHLVMPAVVTLPDYHYLWLWHVKSSYFGYENEKERKKENHEIGRK
jgi:hypothetical protein